jgi:hypothetical protein
MKSLACRTIKQDGVSLSFPNRGHFDRSGTVQTKEDSAGLAGADQNAFGHPERVQFKLVVLT